MPRCPMMLHSDDTDAPLHPRSLLRPALQLLRFCHRGAADGAVGRVRGRRRSGMAAAAGPIPGGTTSPGIDTIYFGGGTPSHVDPAAFGRILRAIDRDRRIAPGAEITIETNPDDVTAAHAAEWRELGINRVSLGVQSFDPPVLAWMHRTHTAEQVPAAMDLLRRAGFDNISIDLIYGLPGSLARDWGADLDAALALAPEHLSLYSLTVESGTPLGKWTTRGTVQALPDDRVAAEYLLRQRTSARRGLRALRGLERRAPGFPRRAQRRLLASRAVHRTGSVGSQRRGAAAPMEHPRVRSLAPRGRSGERTRPTGGIAERRSTAAGGAVPRAPDRSRSCHSTSCRSDTGNRG